MANRWDWRQLALPGLVAVLVAFAALTKVTSYDTWVHLSLGRWMSEQGRVPRTNLLSHTMPDRPTVDHQWLFQLGLYQLWRAVGVAGLVVAKAVVVGAAFAVVAATARRKGAGRVATACVVLLAAYAARFRFTLRPQIVSFLLLATYLYVLWSWRLGASCWLLVALLPLQVLWANLHGAALLGCALPLAFAAGETLRSIPGYLPRDAHPRPRGWRHLGVLWAVGAAAIPLSLLNPNGGALLTEPFVLTELQQMSGLKEILLDRSALPWADLGGRHAFFAVLAVLALGSVVAAVARRDVTEAGVVAVLLTGGMHSRRFVGLFAIGAAPALARSLSAIAPVLYRRATGASASSRWGGTRSLVAVLALCVVLEAGWRGLWRQQPTGLGPPEGYLPEEEVGWVQAHYPTGNLFNEWEHGGCIAWRTRRAVFLDSRGLLAYDAELVQTYVWSWRSREHLAALLEAHDIAVALVERPALRAQFRALGWVEVHRGPVASVFVPVGGGRGAQVGVSNGAAGHCGESERRLVSLDFAGRIAIMVALESSGARWVRPNVSGSPESDAEQAHGRLHRHGPPGAGEGHLRLSGPAARQRGRLPVP